MKVIVIFLFMLVLSSCLVETEMKTIAFNDLFHNRISKVWVVDQVWVENGNISSTKNDEKDVMISLQNGIVDLIAMKNITRRLPVRIDFFNIAHFSENSILLVPTENSSNQYKIQLKPFKEL